MEEALQNMVLGEKMEGENAYECSGCTKKVMAVKRDCIKKLPKTLIVVLKRFEFDFDTMSKIKVNDQFDFPMEFNFEPYC